MHTPRAIIAAAAVTLTISSCNLLFSPPPDLWVTSTGLGAYEARPRFSWRSPGFDTVREYRARLDGPGGSTTGWMSLESTTTTYRPESFLATGTWTFRVEALAATGTWSRASSVSIPVVSTPPFVPNDPYYAAPPGYDSYYGNPVQWNFEQINVGRLWGLLRGSNGLPSGSEQVVVAVADTGYTEHPDLLDLLDIGSGYDFIFPPTASLPPDYYSRDGDDGIDPDARDEGDGETPAKHSWHGTAVASVIAAGTDNEIGLAGIALPYENGETYLSHMPVRVLGYLGGDTYDIGQGIAYAAGLSSYLDVDVPLPSKPAKIINLSLGAGQPGRPLYTDDAMDPILRAAAVSGVLLVAAAGNERHKGATETTYPANSPYVISVGSVTYDERYADYSNPGTFDGEVPTIDLVAPGGGPPFVFPLNDDGIDSWYEYVPTASPESGATHPIAPEEYGYAGTAGTSFAAPHVAGVLALLATIRPGALNLDTARAIFRESTKDLGAEGWDKDFGYGLLDAVDAYSAFLRVLSGELTVRRATLPAAGMNVRMREPRVEPDGPVNATSLIVEFISGERASIAQAAGIDGTRGMRSAVRGTRRLVYVASDGDLSAERDRLLERDDVEAVYYNYRYRPL